MGDVKKFSYCTECDAPVISGSVCKRCAPQDKTKTANESSWRFECCAQGCEKFSVKGNKIWLWSIPNTNPQKYWCAHHYYKFVGSTIDWRQKFIDKFYGDRKIKSNAEIKIINPSELPNGVKSLFQIFDQSNILNSHDLNKKNSCGAPVSY